MGGIISWTLPLLWSWCLALTLTPYVLAITLGSWLLLFLPPLSSLHATFPWPLLLLFFFFWGSFEFPSIDVFLTLQILLQILHKVSFVDVATLSICKHRSSCYIYKDDSLCQHLPSTHRVSSLLSLFCLTPVPVQLSPRRKQRHSSETSCEWDKSSDGMTTPKANAIISKTAHI